MTVVSYHSTLISDLASQEEAADKTSSHIFLSRGVAGADVGQVAPAHQSPSPAFVMSVLDSESSHMINLGSTAANITSPGTANDPAGSERSQLSQDSVRSEPSSHLTGT
jgi:hypothetical protein